LLLPSKQLSPTCQIPARRDQRKKVLEVEAANQCVERELGRKRRGVYNHYDPELRTKIGKHAATFGNIAAAVH
jgi:hypothetical protein